MKPTQKRISLKSLSPARQDLLICMHEKQFGSIRNLVIVNGEPMMQRAKVTRRRNLTKLTSAKPVSRNFILKDAQIQLLDQLDEVGNGELELVTFRNGLPCELEHSAT
jgi:hypothetical protein